MRRIGNEYGVPFAIGPWIGSLSRQSGFTWNICLREIRRSVSPGRHMGSRGKMSQIKSRSWNEWAWGPGRIDGPAQELELTSRVRQIRIIAHCADCGMPQPEYRWELHLEACIQHRIERCIVCRKTEMRPATTGRISI